MAQLKGNGLWDDIQSNGDAALDKVLGPSFDYTAGIQGPPAKGVGSDGNVGQLVTNAFAVGDYVKDLVTGPGAPYGNEVFVETGGMCKAPGGGIIPRWSYINNKLGGADALPANLRNAIGMGTLDGIIPGMFGDIASLNPLKMMNSLYMSGVPACRAITCTATDANGTFTGFQTKFLVPEFEGNLGACAPADAKAEADLESKEVAAAEARKAPPPPTKTEDTAEKFAPYFSGTQRMNLVPPTDLTPYVFWGAGVLAILFFVVKKL